MRAHAALFASLFGVTLIVSALGVGISGYLAASAVTGVHAGLDAATGQDGALRIEVRRGSDPTTQDAAVRAVIAAETGAPVAVDRTVQGTAIDTAAGALVVASVPDLQSRATLTDGVWGATMLQADAAAVLGLGPGSEIALVDSSTASSASTSDSTSPDASSASATVTIDGTWQATDPLDPYWFGDALVAGGESDAGAGPLVVDESVWDTLDVTPFARWTITPGTSGPDDLASLAALDEELPDALKLEPDVGSTGIVFGGALSDTATSVRANLAAVGGVSPVPLLLIAAMSVVTLAELGRLLVGVRAGESALLRSRGAAAPWLALSTAIEVAVVAIPAAIIGALAAVALVLATTDRLPDVAPTIIAPVAAALVAIGLATLAAAQGARRALLRDSANDSGRARSVAALGLVAGVVAAAAFAVWQFRLYGSPLVRTPAGDYAIDPIAVLATPLALLAVAVVTLALFPLATGLVERVAARGLSLGALPARQLSRRVAVFATPVLIVALAAGGVTVAASYSASWDAATTATREVRNGADVRLVQSSRDPLPVPAALKLDNVANATPVLAADTTLGDDPVSFVAYDPSPTAAGDSTGSTGNTGDTGSTENTGGTGGTYGTGGTENTGSTDSTDSTDPGVALTAQTISATVTVNRPQSRTFELGAWLLDAHGITTRVALEPNGASFTATLPSGSWRLIAVDVRLSALAFLSSVPDTFTVSIDDLSADGTALDLGERWQPQATLDFGGDLAHLNDGMMGASGIVPDNVGATVRFMPAIAGDAAAGDTAADAAAAPTVPVDISQSLADRAALDVGDPISLSFVGIGRTVAGTVDNILPSIPGMTGDYAARADLTAFDIAQLRTVTTTPDTTELWLDSTDPDRTASDIRSLLGANARVTTTTPDAGGSLLASARVALWVGAIGALLLAVVAVSAVAGALLRSRASEIVILRAIGVTARAQASGRRRELAILLAFSIVAGTLGGVIVSELTVAGLARSTVLEPIAALPTAVLFDPLGLAVSLIGVIATLIAVVGVYGARIARQAATISAREDVR